MGTITTLDFTESEVRQRWNNYLNANPETNYTDLAEWRLLFHDLYGIKSHNLAYMDHNNILGIASVYHINSPFMGNMLVTSPFFGHGGLYAQNDSIERALIAETEAIAHRLNVDYIEFRLRRQLAKPYENNDAFLECDLAFAESPEGLWKKSFSANVRQNLRRSEEASLQFRKSRDCKLIHDLLSETIRDLGTPFHALDFFVLLAKYFPDHIYFANVLGADSLIAGGVVFQYRDTINTPYIGSLIRHRHTRANYFQYWSIIKDGYTHNARCFAMGRSPKNSTHIQFKQKWGATPIIMYYNYRVINPLRQYCSVSSPGVIYRLAVNVWKKLPLFVTRAFGHRFFRYIP